MPLKTPDAVYDKMLPRRVSTFSHEPNVGRHVVTIVEAPEMTKLMGGMLTAFVSKSISWSSNRFVPNSCVGSIW